MTDKELEGECTARGTSWNVIKYEVMARLVTDVRENRLEDFEKDLSQIVNHGWNSLLSIDEVKKANFILESLRTYKGRNAKTQEEVFAVFDELAKNW